MTNELVLKILDLASIMTYKEVGEHLSDEFTLSKYTVWKTIHETLLETHFRGEVHREAGEKIHVQVDEKYIWMTKSANKRKYYTLTVFAGMERVNGSNRLKNKTVISSANLPDLKKRLNDVLANRYKVQPGEEVFVSGDFATYIRNFGDSISCCGAGYVLDKFHVYKALRDSLPEVCADDISLNDPDFRKYLVGALSGKEDAAARFNIMFPSFSNQSEHIKDQQSPMRDNAIRHFRNKRHQHLCYGRCI